MIDVRKVLLVPRSAAVKDGGVIRGVEQLGNRCYLEPQNLVKVGDQLVTIRKELEEMEVRLEHQLIESIQTVASPFDASLQAMARLDTIFARAAFGKRLQGKIPKVGYEGAVDVDQFVHPVLVQEDSDAVVPVDLRLSDGEQKNHHHALIISGPNGGGKFWSSAVC